MTEIRPGQIETLVSLGMQRAEAEKLTSQQARHELRRLQEMRQGKRQERLERARQSKRRRAVKAAASPAAVRRAERALRRNWIESPEEKALATKGYDLNYRATGEQLDALARLGVPTEEAMNWTANHAAREIERRRLKE